MQETIERLGRAGRVLVLTGAGVSAESGVPTFRGPGGLWRQRDPSRLATPEAFSEDPRTVWEWYDWRRARVAEARPNPGHHAIARLEPLFESFLLVTQNVDGLHALAGSRALVELHGSLWRLRCTTCGQEREDRTVPLDPLPPRCGCGGLLRPGVVWFGESLPGRAMEAAVSHASRSEVVIVAGTSGLVQPAASLPLLARQSGAWVVEVNTEPTPLSPAAHEVLRGASGTLLPPLVDALAAERAP